MDVRLYFQKVRQVESTIADAYVIVVSLETPDGGKAGSRTEVSKGMAAKLIVDGRVRLATVEETEHYRTEMMEAREAVEQQNAANRLQVTLVQDAETRSSRQGTRNSKN